MSERTFFMVKPNGVERSLVGDVLARMERRGLRIVGLKQMQVSRELAEKHYEEHRDKPFFGELVTFITRSPVVAVVLEGSDAIKVVRSTMGATNPVDASPGTIRGDLALEMGENVVHGSDSPEAAAREISLYFRDDELVG